MLDLKIDHHVQPLRARIFHYFEQVQTPALCGLDYRQFQLYQAKTSTAKDPTLHARASRSPQQARLLCDRHHFEQRDFAAALAKLNPIQQSWLGLIYQHQVDKKKVYLVMMDYFQAQLEGVPARYQPKYTVLLKHTLINFAMYQVTQDRVVFTFQKIAAAMGISERAFYKTWHVRYQHIYNLLLRYDVSVLNQILENLSP